MSLTPVGPVCDHFEKGACAGDPRGIPPKQDLCLRISLWLFRGRVSWQWNDPLGFCPCYPCQYCAGRQTQHLFICMVFDTLISEVAALPILCRRRKYTRLALQSVADPIDNYSNHNPSLNEFEDNTPDHHDTEKAQADHENKTHQRLHRTLPCEVKRN